MAAEGNILCEHPRLIQHNHQLPLRTVYDWWHYLAVILANPKFFEMARPSWRCRMRFGSCRTRCCDGLEETARWSMFLPSPCTTTKRPCSRS